MSAPDRTAPSHASTTSTPALVQPRDRSCWSRRTAIFGAALAALAPVLTTASPALAARRPVPPADEAARDAALIKVREAILAAARTRNIDALLAHVTRDVQLDFGGTKGHAALKRKLQREPDLWQELAWVLEHGGRFSDGMFWAPYTFHADLGDIDAFQAGIVVSSRAPAHAAPTGAAAVVATLSHEAVKVVRWDVADTDSGRHRKSRGWYEIRTADGKKAFVEARHIRSAVDYRVGFARRGGTWVIAAFVAGD
jgi:hypothetical protein